MSGDAEGYYNVDPEQDGLSPILVYCNMSSSPVTAVLHHNREEWTHVTGYGGKGSYHGEVGSVTYVRHGLIRITGVNLVVLSMGRPTKLTGDAKCNNNRKSLLYKEHNDYWFCILETNSTYSRHSNCTCIYLGISQVTKPCNGAGYFTRAWPKRFPILCNLSVLSCWCGAWVCITHLINHVYWSSTIPTAQQWNRFDHWSSHQHNVLIFYKCAALKSWEAAFSGPHTTAALIVGKRWEGPFVSKVSELIWHRPTWFDQCSYLSVRVCMRRYFGV